MGNLRNIVLGSAVSAALLLSTCPEVLAQSTKTLPKETGITELIQEETQMPQSLRLGNYFFIGKELKGMKLSSVEDTKRFTGLPLDILRKANLLTIYDTSNPHVAEREEIVKLRRDLTDLVRYGTARYFIPSEKEKVQDIANIAFIDLKVYLFESEIDAWEAMSQFGYTKKIDCLLLTRNNAVIIIDAQKEVTTPMQAISYMGSVLNYKKRTNTKIFAKDEETQRNLEETLRKAYEEFTNPANKNPGSMDKLLERFFEFTPEAREHRLAQREVFSKYYSKLKEYYASESNQ